MSKRNKFDEQNEYDNQLEDNEQKNRPSMQKDLVALNISVAFVILIICIIAYNYASSGVNIVGSGDESSTTKTPVATSAEPSTNDNSAIETSQAQPDQTNATPETQAPEQTAPAGIDIPAPPAPGTALSLTYDKAYFKDDLFFGESMASLFGLYSVIDYDNIFYSDNMSHNNLTTKEVKTSLGTMNIASYVKDKKPKRMFIFIGTNSLTASLKPETMVLKLEGLVNAVKEASPETKLYVLGHTGMTSNSTYKSSKFTPDNIKAYNDQVKVFTKVAQIGYIDTYSLLLDTNGDLNKDYASKDGLFLNTDGLKAIVSYIQTALK